jgi:hypothetical protein
VTNLLTGLDKLISEIAGPLLFSDGIIVRGTAAVSDGRGGFVDADPEAYSCKCLVTDYTDYQRATGGIPRKDRKIIVLGASTSVTPQTGDMIVTGGREWQVIELTSDPANATYEAQGRGGQPTEIAVALEGNVDRSDLSDLTAIFEGDIP